MSQGNTTEASLPRRNFLKGLGLAATTAAASGTPLLAREGRGGRAPETITDLTDAPLVMIWRRVEDLPAMKKTVTWINGWPMVGEDGYSAMFDAGNVLVAYWNQNDFLTGTETEGENRLKVAIEASCTVNNLDSGTKAFNPSNQMTVGMLDSQTLTKRLQRSGLQPGSKASGASAAFVDDTGNSTRYLPLADVERYGKINLRLKSLREAGLLDGGEFHPLVSYDLLVSNLATSRAFYSSTLGLRVESESKDEVIFDTGNVSLRIQQEESVGLLQSIRGKLSEDLMVFYTTDVEEAVSNFTHAGMVFPNGIEDSPHGRLAVFKDPDGHSLSIWEVPPRNQKYSQVLDRLRVSAAAHATA